MAYFYILSDPHMNYTLNRPLADGEATGRIAERKSWTRRSKKDIASWTSTFLEAAKRAERKSDGSMRRRITIKSSSSACRGSSQQLLRRLRPNDALGMKGVTNYENNKVPYPGGYLPGFRLQAKGEQIVARLVLNGGYDSFVEEFYPFSQPLTELGFTVIGFDGPGQGGALRQGICFDMPGRSLQSDSRPLQS